MNQAVEALGQILPWMLLTVFAVSLLIALFYSRYLSKPVQKLGAASDKMANLDFSVLMVLNLELRDVRKEPQMTA